MFLLFFAPVAVSSPGVKPETLKAWDNYIKVTESRLRPAADGQKLWTDQEPGRCERVLRGEILAAPTDGNAPKAVFHGLIHDWVGAVFIPHAALSDVLAIVQD